MCDVCVAEQALAAGRCGKESCVAFQRGEEIRWEDAPPLTQEQADPRKARLFARLQKKHPVPNASKWRGKMANRTLKAYPTVFVRARGKCAEFKTAQYQLRRMNDPWPKTWTKTKDLAGSMCRYGLDVRWDCVPKIVKDWVLRRRSKQPIEAEIERALPKKKAVDLSKTVEMKFGPGGNKVFFASMKAAGMGGKSLKRLVKA